ncbi:hypothetical protein LSH36_84g05001 [Paralvinella palmiformis]|uniref:Uncharacterized protein n=1 Tax=Paralvinella palmiformis TaxID=53620 RepID=A0AAD9K1R4_9ANNE|nr:hypothetical protein LSH36_84g05001 [Paralvinella palmiformis]
MVSCEPVPGVASSSVDCQKGSKINQVGQYLLSRLEQRCHISVSAVTAPGENSYLKESTTGSHLLEGDGRCNGHQTPALYNKLGSYDWKKQVLLRTGSTSFACDDKTDSASGRDFGDEKAQCPLSLTGDAFNPSQYCNGLQAGHLSQPQHPRCTQPTHPTALIVPKKRKSPPASDDSCDPTCLKSCQSPNICLSGSGSMNGSSSAAVVLETPTSTVIVTTPPLLYTSSKSCLPSVTALGAHHTMPLTIPQYLSSSLCYHGVGTDGCVHSKRGKCSSPPSPTGSHSSHSDGFSVSSNEALEVRSCTIVLNCM